jgi:regulator of protease activity HflC (stomatin/prohibitin superfamily)
LGITVEQVDIKDLVPPRYVKRNFEAVLSAQQERQQTNELAQAYASRLRSTAVSEANAIVNAAETERTRQVEAVAAEAKYFASQLPYYRENPQLFTARLRIEAIGRVLTNSAVEKYLMPDSSDGRSTLWLQLNRAPEKPQPRQP